MNHAFSFFVILILSPPCCRPVVAGTGGANSKDSVSVDADKYVKWMKKISDMDYTLPEGDFEMLKRVTEWLGDKAFLKKESMWKMVEGLVIDCENKSSTECELAKRYAKDWIFSDWDANEGKRKLQAGGITADGTATSFGEGLFGAVDNSTEIPEIFGYAQYGNSLEFPDDDLSVMMKRLDGPLPSGLLPEGRKITRILQRITRSEVAFATTFATPGTEDWYSSFFSPPRIGPFGGIPNPSILIPEPEVIDRYEDDSEFARQYLAGANPLSIRRCMNASLELTPEITAYLEQQGIELDEAVSSSRVYYASYEELSSLTKNPHDSRPFEYYNESFVNTPYTFAPSMVVFILDGQELLPRVIQIGFEAEAKLFSPSTSSDEEWLVAKMTVANADAQIHQFVHHLGFTHLAMEPIIIAIHNVLRLNDHPLWDLLLPVVRDTLSINVIGRDTAFSYDSAGSTLNTVSSIGTAQCYQLIRDRWLKYSFMDLAFDKEIESRGFSLDSEDLPSYYYKQDGAKLWAAYGQFVTDFVNEVYESDAQVASDEILQEWAIETTDAARAAIPGFPVSFVSKEVLAETLQVIMWMAGGLHAALNFPQFEYYSYIPNRPLAFESGDDFLMTDVTTTSADPRAFIFSDILPVLATPSIIQISMVLTTPTDYPINGLSNHFFEQTVFGRQSYADFLVSLETIGQDIDNRNDALAQQGKATYPYLHPSVVPASIDS